MALLNLGRFWNGQRVPALALVIGTTILIGGAIALGARIQLDRLLTIHPGAAFEIEIAEVSGDCGTPSLYVMPSGDDQSSQFDVLIDFLGGSNRFPRLGGVAATTPVLNLPEDRPPGVGLGRGLVESCDHMRLALRGPFTYAGIARSFPGADYMPMETNPATSSSEARDGEVIVDYRPHPGSMEGNALVAVKLTTVPDLWQYAYKRAEFTNRGAHDLNIFFYEEPGYLFVNSTDNVVRPINTSRSFADAYLAVEENAGQNSVVIYRRKPTSDVELQHALISISTVFGIGVSLFVEGLVFALITFATRGEKRAH